MKSELLLQTTVMKRLLTKEDKRNIRETFKDNAVFRVINAAYKEQETQMESLRFSPEEIWVNCFYCFDKILKNPDDIKEATTRMWHDTYCELRDETQEESREYLKEELETATSCIIYSVIACMTASEDWNLFQHTESLMMQISEHSDLDIIVLPFDKNLDNSFISFIKEYIDNGKRISETINSPKQIKDPFNPVRTPKDRLKTKSEIEKRLEFMKGVLPNDDTRIMTSQDYNKMIEAVDYLIENNIVKQQESKIRTNLSTAHLRFTFYLVYKNEGNCINRELWLEFLKETFSQMQKNQASLSKHFSDKPNGYDSLLNPKKKK